MRTEIGVARSGRGWLWAAAAFLMLVAALPGVQAKDEAGAYGKTLEKIYDLSPETLAKFQRFQEKQAQTPGDKGKGIYANTERWRGDELSLPTSKNPFTVVVKVSGVALADGDAGSRWQTSLQFDGPSPISFLPELVHKGARAGQPVSMVGAAKGVSFKEDRKAAPQLEFESSRNLRIDRVQVEVWSGIRKSTWVELLMSWSPILTGVVFLGVVLWFRRR
ncbi:hypothetical protein [Acidovorax sp.]|uniref:hypothetical protein n=1 Tax=Acidovorax sp. TaxID=1872122 RepID=UPI00391F67E7